jgi:hypothetical protein
MQLDVELGGPVPNYKRLGHEVHHASKTPLLPPSGHTPRDFYEVVVRYKVFDARRWKESSYAHLVADMLQFLENYNTVT